MHNDDEWGNIELSNFSDEELFAENITYRLAAQNRWSDNKTRENYLKAFKDRFNNLTDEQRKEISKKNKLAWANMSQEQKDEISKQRKDRWNNKEFRDHMMEYYNNPEYKEYITKRNREVAQRPEMQEWYKEFNKAKREDPEHIKRHAKGVKDRSNNNEEWIRKNCRPVSTPYGVFEKAKDAAIEYQKEHGGVLTSVSIKLRQWYKKDSKPDWKYITWEEYDKWSTKK